jgi:predicted amidohydrolase
MSRYVTVASVSHSPCADAEELLLQAARYVHRARRMGADIIVFPEVYPHLHASLEDWPKVAEEIPGPTCTRMMQVAANEGLYILWPLVERRGAALYNTLAVIDRQGQIIGSYSKMFPTTGEMEAGIMPGTEATVIETDFGRIGMAICFDMNWRPLWEGLAAHRAEIVFFSSMYRGSRQMQAWAFEFGFYLVSAICADLGQIVDQTGHVLKTSHQEVLITQTLNLNRRLLHLDFNWEKLDAMLEKYGEDLTFDLTAPEGRFALGCKREGLDVEQIIDEFGLERLEDYWARVLRRREKMLREGHV